MPFEDMTEWEDGVERDWRAFRTVMADRVNSLPAGASIVLEQIGDPKRRLSFFSRPDGMMVCTLHAVDALPSDQQWRSLDGAAILEMPNDWVDLVVSAAVDAVRSSWNLPHPTFLTEETATRKAVDLDIALYVDGVPALDAAIGRIMSQSYGRDAVQDSDGTVSVVVGATTAYVYAPTDREVRIHATVVKDVSGRTRAAEVLGDLNRLWPSIKFLLVQDRIHAAVSVQTRPLVPIHLVRAFDGFVGFLRTIDDRFIESFSGSRPGTERPVDIGEDAQDDDLPAALLTLLDMDSVSVGSLEPDVVAAVCGRDRSIITEYAAFCAEQAEAWRECAAEARPADAARAEECEAEALPWDRVLRALRAASKTVGSPDRG